MGLSVGGRGVGMQRLSFRLALLDRALAPAPAAIKLLSSLSSQRNFGQAIFSVSRRPPRQGIRKEWRTGVARMLMPGEGSQQQATITTDSSAFSRNQTSTSVEHVVFFKVTDGPEAEDLFEELRALKSLDVVSELSAGKVLQILGADYTHVLHSRHPTRAALEAYAVHPSHQAVVKKLGPLIEDRLAVDWEAQPVGLAINGGRGAARLAVIKLSDHISDEERSQVFTLLSGLRGKFQFIRQTSVGLNFSPARAKGYNLGFVALFDNVHELEQLNGNSELHAELRKSRVSPFLEKLVIADVDSKQG